MKKHLFRFSGGILIGSAFILPGVSGPAIALVLGLYDDLIKVLTLLLHAPRSMNKEHISLLATIVAGIAAAFLLLSRLLNYMMGHMAMVTYAFFIGLILGCIPTLYSRLGQKSWKQAVFFSAGLSAILILTFSPETLFNFYPPGHSFSFLDNFFTGMLNSILLPGLSGSYLMLLLGNYQHMLAALSRLDVIVLAEMGAGILLGLFIFTGVVNWLLKDFHSPTYAFLIGMMAGSIAALWPFSLPVNFHMLASILSLATGLTCSLMLDRSSIKEQDS